jgi:hypothetical protein
MPLDATFAGSAANSYLTSEEAALINEEHPYGSAWNALGVIQQENLLMMATRYFDAGFNWKGVAATLTQALAFPMAGLVYPNGNPVPTDSIPSVVKFAVAELARALSTSDRTLENTTLARGITKIKADTVEIAFRDDLDVQNASLIIPMSAKALIPKSWYYATDYVEPVEMLFEVS